MLFHSILFHIAAFLASGVLGATGSLNGFSWRIVNGTNALPGQYPFQVSLQYDGKHACGATIVTDKWILTAAHCVEESIAADFSVLAGTIDLNNGGVSRKVVSYRMHDGYDPADNLKNDIALVELESALPITSNNYIKPVTLPAQSQVTKAGLQATVIGWGYLYSGGPTSDILQTVNLLTYSDAECSSLLGGNSHPTNICAGVPGGGKGHCEGDSGGPLIVNGYQAGIVSWSVKPCASPPYPGIYIEVSHYIDWITGIINSS